MKMLTYTGKELDLQNPVENQICIEDISHALSNICRFSGNCEKFYSVAQHSCYVAELVPNEYKLSALLHDATETYISDIPTPVKKLFPSISKLENNISDIIALKFRAPFMLSDRVKLADKSILAYEFRDLMGVKCELESKSVRIIPWHTDFIEKKFMVAFEKYTLVQTYFKNLGYGVL